MESLTIRPLTTVDEIFMVNELEERTWSKEDVIPIHQKITAVKNGGLVLGAFVDEKLVGFQYSFAGFDGKKPFLCSHMLAVDPVYQHLGIGEKIKLAQKQLAQAMGYQLITWTYDPLESVNGYFNIGKLGAVCRKFIENCYGFMNDNLNKGLPSDRLMVEWWINSDHVKKKLSNALQQTTSSRLELINDYGVNKQGQPEIKDEYFDKINFAGQLYIAIPKNFQNIKQHNHPLAVDWRVKVKDIFVHYFNNNWVLIDFIKNNTGSPVNFYVLKKDFNINKQEEKVHED
ncbi:MAG: GNAT family N-acetyltransferase [Bacillota bacterium]